MSDTELNDLVVNNVSAAHLPAAGLGVGNGGRYACRVRGCVAMADAGAGVRSARFLAAPRRRYNRQLYGTFAHRKSKNQQAAVLVRLLQTG